MIKEHDCIVLTQDLPDDGLQAGDVGTVVHVHCEAAVASWMMAASFAPPA